jgi:MoaA/NifB/PqqE/SkfB family radical SAM enzyme
MRGSDLVETTLPRISRDLSVGTEHAGTHPVMVNLATQMSFERVPQRVYWEVTRACSLACRHCRAEAVPHADPDELSTAEGSALLAQIASFGEPKPHVVLTGGDPLERADLFDLIARARSLGLRVSVSPSATPRLTPEVVRRLREAGVDAISLSVDGSTARRHDALRGVQGCFVRTIAALRAARDESLMVQVNTLVCADTIGDLPGIHALAADAGAARWSLFFLVQVGRGAVLRPVDAAAAQRVLEWLADLPRGQGPVVSTTEAPHFRRVLLERRRLPVSAAARAGFGIRDGNGVVFVSHTGEVSPSGFLPIAAGNVRSTSPVEIYRAAPLFRALRHPEDFGGRCGACRFHSICGGSRARAWASCGDELAEDPLCTMDLARVPPQAAREA